MIQLDGLPVTVAGAGAFGLAIAVRLADAGAKVRLCDPDLGESGASAVAAGMLAPAMEAALDPETGATFALLRAARDRWPAFAERLGAPLDRSGSLYADADAAAAAAVAQRLRSLGAAVETLQAGDAQALQPALAEGLAGVYTREDWRVSPAGIRRAALGALRTLGGVLEPRPVLAAALDPLTVIATGAAAPEFAGAAPELARLSPIKGQILHFRAPPLNGATLRGPGGYVAPQPDGAVVGATMEPGVRDRSLDPEALEGLRRAGAALAPALARAEAVGRAGVRAATPDGLPLVGRSVAGPLLAVGARRNGWLLAPLVAEAVLATLAGEPLPPEAVGFAPGRFG